MRLGSAGDPTVIDLKVWKPLLDVCKNHTGYTHQWREDFAQQYKGIVQASCDSFQDYLVASGLGFKCFYVKDSLNFEIMKLWGSVITEINGKYLIIMKISSVNDSFFTVM